MLVSIHEALLTQCIDIIMLPLDSGPYQLDVSKRTWILDELIDAQLCCVERSWNWTPVCHIVAPHGSKLGVRAGLHQVTGEESASLHKHDKVTFQVKF